MKAQTREKLLKVSCATLTTALFKRGLRNVFLQNVNPLSTKEGNMVGPAFTLRYVPAREDLNTLKVFENPEHPQRLAIETCAGVTFPASAKVPNLQANNCALVISVIISANFFCVN